MSGERVNNLLELAGFACLVALAYLLYPLAGLGLLGVGLIVAANVRDLRVRRAQEPEE